MAKHDVPFDITYLVSIWTEALVYGFFVSIFCASCYVHISLRSMQDTHSRIMFGISTVMFIIATLHVAMNCYRMIAAYCIHRLDPGGPVGYISQLAPWDHVFKDTLYATQEIFGDAVAIYRTYVVWGRDWRPVFVPSCLLIVSLVSGYTVCGLYTTEDSNSTVFDPRLAHWITTFYAITVVQSGLTTGLMAFRIWQADRRSAVYRAGEGSLMPILRILIESASIQFIIEVILLSLYSANYNAQYLLLEMVTPLVGITFGAITIRIALRQSETLSGSKGASDPRSTENVVATIGTIPMRPMPININITRDIEAHGDRSEVSSVYDQKSLHRVIQSSEDITTIH